MLRKIVRSVFLLYFNRQHPAVPTALGEDIDAWYIRANFLGSAVENLKYLEVFEPKGPFVCRQQPNRQKSKSCVLYRPAFTA